MTILHFLPPVLLSISLMGCGQSSGPSVTTPPQPVAPASAAAVEKEVALVMKTLTNPFFVEMEKGARRAEKELGINLTVKTAAQETSIEQQIQLVEDLISDKVDAIVIAPGDSQRLIPALKKARDAGISIVNIDNRLDPEAVKQAGMAPVPFVSVDNEAAAYMAGKFLADSSTRPTQAAILEGIRSADNAQQRAAGARRAFAESPLITLVASDTANWKIDEAYTVTQQMFARHPQIKLLFASNDVMAIGALKYLQESRHKGVKVAGFDALQEAIAEIRSKRLAATVDQQASEQGYQGVALALRLTQGSSVANVTLIDARLITAGNLP